MRSDTKFFPGPGANGGLLGCLTASTCSSAGLDVCTAATVVIDSCGVHKIPLDAFGPVGGGMSAFLMGMSSATSQGIMVHLGFIDADFTGQIYAMVSTPTHPPITIPEGTRLTQLVPFKSSVRRAENRLWRDGSFGSTGPPQVHWTAVLTKDCPEKVCTLSIPCATLSEIRLRGLLDTGADIIILSLAAWPLEWPLELVQTSVAGLAGMAQCYISQRPVMITNPEGQTAMDWLHVTTETHVSLWGRDVLATWGTAHWDRFLMRVTAMKVAECPTPPIWWLVDKPVWENQWPLPQDKLVALHDLVQEQLYQGHLESSTSLWNTPVFCIKKSEKWRLLQDLWKINAVMESMGMLLAGMPLPTMLPADWLVLIVDLKDCFFTIPLHPNDRLKFAFSVPAINNAEPIWQYQWRVLP
ncbi:hypothetical protein DUI87_15539 [Hirundo rustica rustica]|uniref:ribonuclease H n=1 Tax=Hirundo rustica rustica TaxID=333673 RepID=A0A3M0K472_HIRRU|nr:hypothetical protein DUI87_15539 [Hirundo rustica rustica]